MRQPNPFTIQIGTLKDHTLAEQQKFLHQTQQNMRAFRPANKQNPISIWNAIQRSPLASRYWERGKQHEALYIVGVSEWPDAQAYEDPRCGGEA